MPRIAIGFVLAPLSVSLIVGILSIPSFFVVTFPVMLVTFPVLFVISVVCGIPAFLLFWRYGWLKWWQVTLGGVICSVPLMALYAFGGGSSHLEIYGPLNILTFAALGAAVGVAFWWIALFRNKRLPMASTSFPTSMLFLVPAVAIGVAVHRALEPVSLEGRIRVPAEGLSPGAVTQPMATVKLRSGETVFARVPGDFMDWPETATCVYLESRPSLLFRGSLYWISTFKFGEHDDDC